jgi:hypothetical protein
MPTGPLRLPDTHAGEVEPCHDLPRQQPPGMWLPITSAESAMGKVPRTLRAADVDLSPQAAAGRRPSTPAPCSVFGNRPVPHRPYEASNVDKQLQRTRLPTMVEQLLVEVVADGFALYRCGPKAAPRALLACYEWDDYVDLLTIVNFDRLATARVPKRDVLDIFAPEVVVWAYEGPAQHALRALLDLVHPAHPDAPLAHYPAPLSLHIPRDRQRPMTIRLPSPGRARMRAERLTAAMTRARR